MSLLRQYLGYCRPYSALGRAELFLNIRILWYLQHKPAHLSNQVSASDTSPPSHKVNKEPIWLLSITSTIREKFCYQCFARRQLLALKQLPRSTAYSMYPDMLLLKKKLMEIKELSLDSLNSATFAPGAATEHRHT